jgi:1,4-dihydroxy-2-naphthoate octaprenyltransferase
MKYFFASKLFAFVLCVILALTIMSFVFAIGPSTLLLAGLIVGVLIYASTRRLRRSHEKENPMPSINFDQHCIECKQTGKILYQFTLPEWNVLSLEEKYDMMRLYRAA